MGIKLSNLSYQNKIKNINYQFPDGQITSVIASSGGGKTTLSYLLAGILNGEGKVENSWTGRELGYVFQRP